MTGRPDRRHPTDEFLDQWIEEELAAFPVVASTTGADGDHGALTDLSERAILERRRRDQAWLETMTASEGMPDGEAETPEQHTDRQLLRAFLSGRVLMADWEVWRRDPATYLGPCLDGAFTLILHRLFPEPELAGYVASRLRAVPDVLAAGRENLEASLTHPVFVQRAIGQCRAAAVYFRELLPWEIGDEAVRSDVVAASEVAAGAVESFCRFLEELADTATGGYAIGEQRYSSLLLEREMLGAGATELRRRGQEAWDELSAEMDEVAAAIQPGAGGWAEVVATLNEDHPGSPDEMRRAYSEETERARAFLIENGLVTLAEGERCVVEPSPPFQRPILAVASYSMPPAFRPGLTGHFFVPYPPDGSNAEDTARRLQANSHHSIPSITAHEAYPGHHWHLTWSKSNPRRIRHLLRTPYFSEGWGLYAERVMAEHGFYADQRARLCYLDARIFRAARVVVDTSLHVGDMGFEEAVAFMRTRASLPEPVARAEVGRYCSWPTQAASYLTGAIEIERIRGRYLASGRGDLRAFHDAIAGSGSLPLGLAEASLLG